MVLNKLKQIKRMKNNQPFDTVLHRWSTTWRGRRHCNNNFGLTIWERTGQVMKGGWLLLIWFLENVGKLQDPDSNDSLRPAGYDAIRILVRRCKLISENFRFFQRIRYNILFWMSKYKHYNSYMLSFFYDYNGY